MVSLALLLVLLTVNPILSARIAGFHAVGGSQYISTRLTLEELASRGHEVVMFASSSQKIKRSEKVPHKIYEVPYKPGFLENEMIRHQIEGHPLQMFLSMKEILASLCEAVLNNTEIIKEMKGFDLIVYDGLSFCGVLLGEHLDIRRVELIPASPNSPASFMHMVPMPISYVPQLLTGFNDKMTFMERVINFGAYFGGRAMLNIAFGGPMNAVKVKYNIKPERSFQEAVGDAAMCIITADFALEYPQPLLPGQVMVGPLNVRDPKPLPPDLEEFVNGSGGHGFIIVSFGSNVASILPKNVVDMLATALGRLKQRVFWRLKGYIPSFLASNIKIVEWLPQNDLLAHKDIKAFVSHMGHNSVYESAYHGVPLVAFPLFGDQPANAKKVEHFGFGVTVNYDSSDAQKMFEAIERVTTEPRFKAKAMHISALMKDRRRTPLQETGDWIEYVLRHGGARHLRAQVFYIPWYQYYLLDVIAFLVAIVTLVVMVIRMTCRCMCRLWCHKRDVKPKKE